MAGLLPHGARHRNAPGGLPRSRARREPDALWARAHEGMGMDDLAVGHGIKGATAVALERLGRPFEGTSMAIEGFGKVGAGTARACALAGARIVASARSRAPSSIRPASTWRGCSSSAPVTATPSSITAAFRLARGGALRSRMRRPRPGGTPARHQTRIGGRASLRRHRPGGKRSLRSGRGGRPRGARNPCTAGLRHERGRYPPIRGTRVP